MPESRCNLAVLTWTPALSDLRQWQYNIHHIPEKELSTQLPLEANVIYPALLPEFAEASKIGRRGPKSCAAC